MQFTATGSKIQTNLGQQSLMLKCELGAWVGRKNKRNDLDNEIHVYDSVFRTMIHNLKPYVPALVNEALGEHYTDKALVTLKAGKELQSIMGGYIIKTDIDEAMEKTEEQVSVSYMKMS